MLNSLINYLQKNSPLLYLTQSLWRDEAYSVLLALKSPFEIIKITTNDFGPPLFYLILHYWIKIAGTSEIPLRLLPLLFHLGTVYTVYLISKVIARNLSIGNWKLSIAAPALAAVNPMLLYYAFEVRSYSLLAFLYTLSIYALISQKKLLYIISSTLGFYTHYYFILGIFAQYIYLLITDKKRIKIYLAIPPIAFIAWMPAMFNQTARLGQTWYSPVTTETIKTSLASLFTNYVKNPEFISSYASFFSLFLFIISIYILYNKKLSPYNSLFVLWVLFPTITTLAVSLTIKSVWVNRYLIFVAVGETLLLSFFISTLPDKLRQLVFLGLLFLILIFNFRFVKYQKKHNYREALSKLKTKLSSKDLVVLEDILGIFPVKYYLSSSGAKVVYYNPTNESLPSYVGTALLRNSDIINKLPKNKTVYFLTKSGRIIIYNL